MPAKSFRNLISLPAKARCFVLEFFHRQVVRATNIMSFTSPTPFNFSAHPKSKPLLQDPLMAVPSYILQPSVSRHPVQ
jgi:hypothetical protein